ncbi:E3 ubiquitin-protein ligase LNX isoform X5 [Pogoniulus pusillus]|uniref:E3 ubiquitin-protein ligase LNX isoform X5 n=1 Tax=Pogoniulus pusillus TaxID=488313 RepID=UPI0030B9799A
MEGSSLPLCAACGQAHPADENHLYSYAQEVDDDLICHICLQPLLQPLDTLCGHTFCTACLTSFLLEKDFCPMDRKLVVLQSCRKSSILVHNLLDKLLVSCPFTAHCSEVLQRGHLQQHFQTQCKGASHYGLTKERKRRSQDCSPAHGSSLAVAALDPELSAAAAIALMSDEPGLVNPAFSPTSEESQAGSSPGDLHRGSRSTARHFERSTLRSRSFKKINKAFSVLRRTKSGSAVSNHTDRERESPGSTSAAAAAAEAFPRLYHLIPDGEVTCIKISRSDPQESLAIRIVGGSETPLAHIIIQHIYQDGVIARDGRLLPGDIILKASEKQVHFVVSRQTRQQTPDILQETGWTYGGGNPQPCPAERHNKSTLHTVTCHEKVVAVRKDHTESLGMTVAGGASNREWDLPIYVISVEPGGVISRDSRIKTGDILLNVNGVDLTGVSRSEAVALLKNTNSSVVLKALEMRTCEGQEQQGHLPASDGTEETSESSEWSPSWVMWLGLPRYLYSCKEIVLRRNTAGSLGFSIVGGYEEHSGSKPFFIKSIVGGTPAYNDGRIRCGDILLAVNGRNTSGMMHSCLAKMLKELKGKITLTIVSWPGTFV